MIRKLEKQVGSGRQGVVGIPVAHDEVPVTGQVRVRDHSVDRVVAIERRKLRRRVKVRDRKARDSGVDVVGRARARVEAALLAYSLLLNGVECYQKAQRGHHNTPERSGLSGASFTLNRVLDPDGIHID